MMLELRQIASMEMRISQIESALNLDSSAEPSIYLIFFLLKKYLLSVYYMLEYMLWNWNLKIKEFVKSLPSRSQCNCVDRYTHR